MFKTKQHEKQKPTHKEDNEKKQKKTNMNRFEIKRFLNIYTYVFI